MSIKTVLEAIYNNPSVLKQKTTFKFLLDKVTQQTRNSMNYHEACFADLLESNGFKQIAKKGNAIDQNYYRHEPNGSQRSPDFEVYDKTLNKTFKFDLKHTNNKIFYFNDGWYEKDIIYIISWTPKKNINTVLIGYGQDIATETENERMKLLNELKREYNSKNKRVESLIIYIRFANKYCCEKFTEEYSKERFNAVVKNLALPPQQPSEYKEVEQHSQPV